MSPKYSEEQKQAAVQSYMSGQGGIRQIARTYGVSRGALIQWVAFYKKNGQPPRKGSTPPHQQTARPLPPRDSSQFRLEVLYWQQLHKASDLETAATFHLRGMETVSKWRKHYLENGRLRLFRDRDGLVKTRRKEKKAEAR